MSSSTSSSDDAPAPRSLRNEWKVVCTLLLVFIVAELGVRVFETRLSLDIAHIRDADNVAARFAPESDGYDVLILGNSSARSGIDAALLTKKLERGGLHDVHIHFFHPDGGNVGNWRWAWRRYFSPPRRQPDLVLICGSRSHFDDARLDPVSSASLFVGLDDALPFLSEETRLTEERLDFLMAKLSLSFAGRHRVQRRFLDYIMPYNRLVLSQMADHASRKAASESLGIDTLSSFRLAELLADLQAAKTIAAVVALPSIKPYEVPASRISIVQEKGAFWLDLRTPAAIQRDDFYDGAHVNQAGAQKLTSALAEALGELPIKPLH